MSAFPLVLRRRDGSTVLVFTHYLAAWRYAFRVLHDPNPAITSFGPTHARQHSITVEHPLRRVAYMSLT